ncbi:hypothetical protein CCR95_19340 [Thiocystis minor]|uniref:HGGxSTG domain-containing protein n=1 Tax=Thiocystis minor TaxID=61597 RepID=UPI0019113637|nr:hypothetical protein [Thiocystis minor]
MTEAPSNSRPSRKRKFTPVCGAKTRRGTPCQCKPLKKGGRCKFHGGASTGPTTTEGKETARANLQKASAVINSSLHAETRRARSLKGWETRRKKAQRRRLIEIGRMYGIPTHWL